MATKCPRSVGREKNPNKPKGQTLLPKTYVKCMPKIRESYRIAASERKKREKPEKDRERWQSERRRESFNWPVACFGFGSLADTDFPPLLSFWGPLLARGTCRMSSRAGRGGTRSTGPGNFWCGARWQRWRRRRQAKASLPTDSFLIYMLIIALHKYANNSNSSSNNSSNNNISNNNNTNSNNNNGQQFEYENGV